MWMILRWVGVSFTLCAIDLSPAVLKSLPFDFSASLRQSLAKQESESDCYE